MLERVAQETDAAGLPLHAAAVRDDASRVCELLAAAPDPCAAALQQDLRGKTPLFVAVERCSRGGAAALLEAAPETAMVPCKVD